MSVISLSSDPGYRIARVADARAGDEIWTPPLAEEETSMSVRMRMAAGLLIVAMMAGATATGRSQQNTPNRSTSTQQQQQQQQQLPPIAQPSPLDLSRDPVPDHTRIAERQAIAANDERQKKLMADTEKLLALATELKTDVDKSTKDTLSIDVIKKADEIEKLARSVKEKMKD